MIYNQTHLTELQAPVQTINSRVELYSGSTLVTTCNCHDTLRDFSITRAGSENKYFGFGICQKAQIHLIDIDRAITIDKTNTVKVAFGAKGEYIYTVPTFKIDDIQRDETSNDITLVTYDVLYGAANHQVSELGLQAPYTVEAVARACAAFLGVGFKIVNVSDNSFAANYPTGANLDGSETIRQLLDAIAEVTQTIYYINQNDELVFKRLDAHGESVLTIGKSDYYELKAHDAHTLAAITSTTELGENLEATYGGTITGVGATQYIRDNPFWELLEPSDVATRLTAAISAIGGIVANPYECEWIGNYLLEIGDKLSFIREDGSVITSFLLDDALEYSGIFEEKSNWLFKENEAETPSNPVTIGEKINQTFARVDKIEREIKLYVGEVVNETVNELVDEAISGSIGDIQQDIEELQTNDAAADKTLAQLQADMGELEKQGTATEQKVAQLTLTTDGINASVESLSTEQATIKNNLNTVTGEQTTLKNDIAALKIADNEITADISSLEQSHTTLNTKVTGIEGEVSTVKTEQSTLKQQQATLSTTLDGISGRVSDVEEKNTEIENEVSGVKTTQNTQSNKLAEMETTLSGFGARVSNVESKNTTIENELTGVKNTQSNHTERIGALEVSTEAIGLRVSNAETTVSEVAASQEGLTESITSTEERLSNLEITAEGINSSVSTLQKNIEETNGQIEAQTTQLRTEIEQTANSVRIDIENIKEEGANKVVTKTGYTFDDDGLTVSKSTSGVSTQITHDGMTVSEHGNELLTADSKGVSAKDLHARTYLIIGGNSRFEDYNSNRTACFWVGN